MNAADTTARLELNRLSADVQKRVSGSCGAGSAIRTIDADGLVVCDAQRSDAEIASAIGQNLQSGAIPASDGSTLVKSSLHMGDTGFVGLATLEPKALLDVAVGFSYSHTLDTIDAGVALPTPRCECDKNNSTKECGTDPSEYNHHGDFCYDWSGDDDWATYALVPDAEPPLSGLAVTDEGKVGIGTFEPLAKLDIRGGVVLDDRSWYRDYSISTALPAVVLNRAGNPLPLNFVGLFFCSVTGTGAPGSSYWMVKRRFDDPVHIEKIVSFDSVGSNTPEIYDDGGTIKIRLYSHANKYPVRCHAQQLW
ncbi:hypothetical protein KAI87_08845 [Myxococcota bacterium]|nr:hypothetical protein [Myxococcota bacterium]